MIETLAHGLLPLALGAGPVATTLAWAGQSDPARVTQQVGRVLGAGALSALLLAALALQGDPQALTGFEAGTFPSLVLVLVLGMGSTVLSFSARSLRHEPYQQRFAVAGAALVSLGALLATTTDLVVLAATWVAATVATLQLVRTGSAAGAGQRILRARRALATGDGLVVAAVVILVTSTGSTAIADLPSASGLAISVAGVLLVVAAAARAATAPFHRWLPDTLSAPTPSSALLHAGVVNGGAIVLIKLAPATTGSWPAAALALVLGGASCVFAEAVMLTRPDVKGRLAWSTVAQMSFTLSLCGLGLHTAAALHLVAHGFYKGALFLGSGGNVRALVRERIAPPVGERAGRGLTPVGFGLTGAAAVIAVLLTGADVSADLLVPLALAWVAAGCAAAAWFHRTVTVPQRLIGAVGAATLVAAFAVTTVTIKHRMGAALDGPGGLHPSWILLVLVALVTVAATRDGAAHGLLGRAWGWVRRAGQPVAAGPLGWAWPERRPGVRWAERPTPTLSPALDDSIGAA